MKRTIGTALLLAAVSLGRAQTNEVGTERGSVVRPALTNQITFEVFLSEVAAANLDYAAQRYNVSIAQAAVAAAREFPNPTVQLSGGRDVTHSGDQRMPTTYGASLTQTIELGGKRKYRIRNARENYAATAATLEGFLRNLKLDAAAAFADALALARSAEEKSKSAEDLARLTETQRARRAAGDISEAEFLQTEVEEQQFQNEVLSAKADAENASIALSGFLGADRAETLLIPKGNLEIPTREFDQPTLVAGALKDRSDLMALRHTRDAAQSNISLEKANRVPNVDVGGGWTHSTTSENSIAPSPAFDDVGVTLSFPLPLWNRNKGAIASARFSAEQAQTQLEAGELKAEVQVREALGVYRSAVERLERYRNGILKNAEAVAEAKRFSYQHGQSTLLELLDAERTENEVRSGYNDALSSHAKALVELERATETWDIQF